LYGSILCLLSLYYLMNLIRTVVYPYQNISRFDFLNLGMLVSKVNIIRVYGDLGRHALRLHRFRRLLHLIDFMASLLSHPLVELWSCYVFSRSLVLLSEQYRWHLFRDIRLFTSAFNLGRLTVNL